MTAAKTVLERKRAGQSQVLCGYQDQARYQLTCAPLRERVRWIEQRLISNTARLK